MLAAITLVYGFSYCTGTLTYAFNARSGRFAGSFRNDPIGADEAYKFVMGAGDYVAGQWNEGGVGFNDLLVVICVVFVVICALQYFFATNSRRNYYITNYISVGILIVYAIVVAAIAFWGISHTEALFNQIDFERYKSVYDNVVQNGGTGWQYYSDSHAIFQIGYAIFALVLVDAILLTLNTVWKYLLMKGEKALLNNNTKLTEGVA